LCAIGLHGGRVLDYMGRYTTNTKENTGYLVIQTPKNKWQLRRFIGMINFYKDMWIRRSEILAPLTRLIAKPARWQ